MSVNPGGDHRDHDRTVVGFTNQRPSITNVGFSNPVHGEVYSVQHKVIKFVSDMRQVGSFFRVYPFPPPIKLVATV